MSQCQLPWSEAHRFRNGNWYRRRNVRWRLALPSHLRVGCLFTKTACMAPICIRISCFQSVLSTGGGCFLWPEGGAPARDLRIQRGASRQRWVSHIRTKNCWASGSWQCLDLVLAGSSCRVEARCRVWLRCRSVCHSVSSKASEDSTRLVASCYWSMSSNWPTNSKFKLCVTPFPYS